MTLGNWFIGICMVGLVCIAGYVIVDIVRDKTEKWWFRLVELIFSLLFAFAAVLLSGQLR